MKLATEVKTLPALVALAYLGFYVWGLAMWVFTPLEIGAPSAVAALCVVLVAGSVVIARRSPESAELHRRAKHWRETRGVLVDPGARVLRRTQLNYHESRRAPRS